MKAHRLIILMCLIAAPLHAASDFPAQIKLSVPDGNGIAREVLLKRNGVARCEWGLFRIDLYDASLYLETLSSDPNRVIGSTQVKRIEQRWLRGLSKNQLAQAFRASFKANAKEDSDRHLEGLNRLCDLMQPVRKGQRLTFTAIPGCGLQISLDDCSLGSVPGDDFARLFVSLYVGDHPPTDAVGRGLLGRAEP